jgi:putative DNA primase/helicase
VERFGQEEVLIQLRAEAAQKCLKDRLKEGDPDDDSLRELAAQATAAALLHPPAERRYVLNEPTIEKLGEIVTANPNGVLVYRDELSGFLKGLDKQGREMDRAFYMEGFNGNAPFSFDRIGRGTTYIETLCLSILGGIQPGPLGEYFGGAAKLGKEHDGLISRFQLLVYPDQVGEWETVDRWPDHEARGRVQLIFDALNELNVLRIGAEFDKFDKTAFLRFAPDAQELFYEWQ